MEQVCFAADMLHCDENELFENFVLYKDTLEVYNSFRFTGVGTMRSTAPAYQTKIILWRCFTMQQNKPKGSVMILVVSILLIIGAAFGLIGSLATGAFNLLMNNAEVQSALSQSGLKVPADQLSGALTFITIFVLVSSIVELVSGIFGLINRNKVEKSVLLIVFGIIMIVVSVLANLVPTFLWQAPLAPLTVIVGLVLPVLYLIGAFLNKNS